MSRSEPRLYHPDDPSIFTAGLEIALSPGQAHYLGVVMRLQPGESVCLFNGRDGEWRGVIVTLKKQKAIVRLECCLRAQQAIQGLTLIFAPVRREATELVIRMGTELGVTCFRPVITERTNLPRLNTERLCLIAQEAAEQCERLDVPEIRPPVMLKTLFSDWPQTEIVAVALEREGAGLAPSQARTLLVGPEGGFSPAEVAFLQNHDSVRCFSLGNLVLRAETASVAGLSQLGVIHRLG